LSYITGDIVSRVQQRVRDTGYSSSEIKSYLNDTQNDIFNEYRLPFMEATQDYTLVANTADITNGSGLPTNFVQPIDLILTTNGYDTLLTPYDVREIDSLYPDYENSTIYPSNIPTIWYKYGQTIKVFPKPNQAYTVTLRYYKRPTLLSADSDVPSVPSEFEEILVLGAAYRVLQVKDNYDQAGILQNKYDELLQKLVMRYSQTQVGTPTRLRINRRAVGKKNY
jgi:hypothetical protein